MSKYVMRVTIFVPAAMVADTNQLALCLGLSAADAETFGGADWQDADGNLYAVASTMAKATFPTAAAALLAAPDFAPDMDITAASRAQAALVLHDPAAPLPVSPRRILAVIHDDTAVARALAGITAAGASQAP